MVDDGSTLTEPTDGATDWASRLVRERGVSVCIGLAVICVGLWPTDPWVFAQVPSATGVMTVWRVGSIAMVLCAIAGFRLQARVPALIVGVVAVVAWMAWTAACTARIDVDNLSFLLVSSALAFTLLPMPLAPVPRAIAHLAGLAVTGAGFFATAPASLDDPLCSFAILIGLTFAWSAWMGGHVVYRLELRSHQQQLELAEANTRAQRLLHNVLPPRVAARLERDPVAIAEACPRVVVLFADLVGFTPRAAAMPPEQMVAMLNEVFSTFDRLTEAHGLEKIKTIGDAYMAAAGLPDSAPDPLGRSAELALALRDATAGLADGTLSLRIGMHVGPVVAGVLGVRKFSYDLWGDTVNTASRMESHGEPGRVHVTAAFHEPLTGRYAFEARGPQRIKGKGTMETWFLDRLPTG